jgi:hypothetical protein
MKSRILLGALLAGLVALAGCARLEGIRVPDAPQGAGQSRRVALISIAEPTLYEVRVLDYDGPVAPGVTLPGRVVGQGMTALVRGADQASRNYQLSQACEYWNFAISKQLTRDIIRAFEARGYEVVHVDAQRPRSGAFVNRLPQTPEPVDAYVDLVIDFVGYVALNPDQPYTPMLEVPVRVVSATEAEVIYQATLTYGGPVPVESASDRPADPAFTVRGFTELCGTEGCEFSPAVQGLIKASQGVSEMLVDNVL